MIIGNFVASSFFYIFYSWRFCINPSLICRKIWVSSPDHLSVMKNLTKWNIMWIWKSNDVKFPSRIFTQFLKLKPTKLSILIESFPSRIMLYVRDECKNFSPPSWPFFRNNSCKILCISNAKNIKFPAFSCTAW